MIDKLLISKQVEGISSETIAYENIALYLGNNITAKYINKIAEHIYNRDKEYNKRIGYE